MLLFFVAACSATIDINDNPPTIQTRPATSPTVTKTATATASEQVGNGGGQVDPTVAASAANQGGVIIEDTQVHTGPGADYLVIGPILKNTPIAAIFRSEDSQWIIIHAETIEGWAQARAVDTDITTLPVMPGPYRTPNRP